MTPNLPNPDNGYLRHPYEGEFTLTHDDVSTTGGRARASTPPRLRPVQQASRYLTARRARSTCLCYDVVRPLARGRSRRPAAVTPLNSKLYLRRAGAPLSLPVGRQYHAFRKLAEEPPTCSPPLAPTGAPGTRGQPGRREPERVLGAQRPATDFGVIRLRPAPALRDAAAAAARAYGSRVGSLGGADGPRPPVAPARSAISTSTSGPHADDVLGAAQSRPALRSGPGGVARWLRCAIATRAGGGD